MPPTTLKVLVIGPKSSGKTTIANFLAGHQDRLGGQEQYQPTVAVRILETECNKASVELWDVSGDQIYEACWPAIIKDAQGVLLVYNPESHSHESEAMLWYEWFVTNPGLNPSAQVKANRIASAFDTPSVIKSEYEKFADSLSEYIETQHRQRK
ncbi:unnamed protein product [Albugo candida]|uniref:G domain-containing protein n=1 Tax=Albugo candida TaxID=65357 RepID=A0A024GUG1_9STRA|nr:unnamed protein product [Albugo candida]|eukprot:CCI50430.1 unnamed protein product [Albugo candida]